MLASLGVPLLASKVCERKDYRRALTQGQAVAEFDPWSKAALEIAALWAETQVILTAKGNARVGRRAIG